MTTIYPELNEITAVTDNIYLSGIFPLNINPKIIKQIGIKYILCCVDRKYVADVHDNVLMHDKNIVIFYLSYNDNIAQDLWKKNAKDFHITKYVDDANAYEKINNILRSYIDTPMIEISYDIIDSVVNNNEKILIHCMAGISRSVSMIIYYLMRKYNINYDASRIFIKNQRSIINPNISFQTQLKNYWGKKI